MRTILLAILLAACSSKSSAPPPSAPPGEPPATHDTPPPPPPTEVDPSCGMKVSDWCSPAGDPCAEHKDAASCKADAKCGGMPYKGESFVACQYDARGFATNCPTVGCKTLAK
jgi:hypothetical protein